MPRGVRADVGSEFTNQNGYQYRKTADRGWVAVHQLIMEEHLGRKLRPNEYVSFKNGHVLPITIDMLELRTRGDKKSKAARIAVIKSRIEELQAELEELEAEPDA